MANIKEPAEMQTPNTVNTEVQETVQANKVIVQPEPENYATSGIPKETTTKPVQTQEPVQNVTQPNAIIQAQTVQPVQNQSNIAVRIPSDLYDQTVQGYLDEFKKGQEINDYQAQINALNAIDQYRTTQGYKPIYTSNVYELTNQRVQKIKNQIRDYETDIATAINSGNEGLAQQIGQQMEAYKKAVNYGETVNNSAQYLQNIEYKSTYDSVISGIVNELLTTRFTYDPSDDEALLKAQEYATNSVYESMNAKGILDSTMTAQIVAKTANELIPIYEKMAKEDFYNNLERLQSMANFVMNLEETQYSRWLDQVQVKLDYYEAQKDEIAYQWDRVNQLGYVDNEASIILGVAPGTMSPSMREAIDEAERQATEQYNKLYSDIALAEAKAEIEAKLYATKKSIDSQYKTGNTSQPSGISSSNDVTKYSGTDSDKKKIIKQKYDNGELDEIGTIEEIYANFGSDKVAPMLSEILGMTEKEAQDTYKNGYASNLLGKLSETYGGLTEENRAYYESEIVALADEGYIDEETVGILDKQIKASLEFNDVYNTISKLLDSYITTANESNKKVIRKKIESGVWSKQLEKYEAKKTDLIKTFGQENYKKLIEMITEKEEKLYAILDEKGVDW